MVYGEGGELVNKEIPAQRETVDAVASGVKRLMGRRFGRTFRIGDAEDGRTLDILNYPVAPWVRHHKDGMRFGREVYLDIKERADVLHGTDMAKKIRITRYRLDTSLTKPPKLRVKASGADEYLDTAQSHEKFAQRIIVPEYTAATEDQAQQIKKILDGLSKAQMLEHQASSITTTERQTHTEQRKQLEQNMRRIFEAGKGFTEDLGYAEQLNLSLGDKTLTLIRNKDRDSLQVSIAEPETTEGATTTTVAENYTSLAGMPIAHETSFKGADVLKANTQTPLKDADAEQKDYLFTVLGMLTDEKIKDELTKRKTIATKIKEVLALKGKKDGDQVQATFYGDTFAVYVGKYTDMGTSFSVHIENFVDPDHPENEGTIIRQNFSLPSAPYYPLDITTYRYGEESGEGKKSLAKDGQIDYLTTLLDELPHLPDTPEDSLPDIE